MTPEIIINCKTVGELIQTKEQLLSCWYNWKIKALWNIDLLTEVKKEFGSTIWNDIEYFPIKEIYWIEIIPITFTT